MKGKTFIIPLVVYPFDVIVSFDQTDEQLVKELDKHSICEADRDEIMKLKDTTRGRCVMFQSNQTCIRLRSQLKKYDMQSLISHEVFHAVSMIMERIGMKLKCGVSCEAYAYLTGYLVGEINKQIPNL